MKMELMTARREDLNGECIQLEVQIYYGILITNHKLIRWHFIIAGGTDGFSRLVTFLRCEDNTGKADTILSFFQNGVFQFGTPVRVRSDKGLENYKVTEYIISVRGSGKGSMLTGKSCHNQRI